MGISREAAFNQLRHTRRAVPVIVETDLCVCVCVRVSARARAREGERERGEGGRETDRQRERERERSRICCAHPFCQNQVWKAHLVDAEVCIGNFAVEKLP